jgi:putative endonuclease
MKNKSNIARGSAGETIAVTFLEGLGMKILARNYRHGKAEIDIIVLDADELVIVEVKIRQNNLYGFPEESVSKNKQKLMMEAGYFYRELNRLNHKIRFDVVAISLDELEIKHFKDAF